MDINKMTEEQKLYFFFGYVYSKAQELHEEFGIKTIPEYIQILLEKVINKGK